MIRQHCYNYRSPPAPGRTGASTLIVRPSTARLVCDKTDSSRARECDASDIDDDELHQLLGVD